MQKVYFVDTENIANNWFSILTNLAKNDLCFVFFTQNSPHLTYEQIATLSKKIGQVAFLHCSTGQNALDFQLCTELGYRICSAKTQKLETEYIIISNDTGYDAVVSYWKARNVKIKRLTTNNMAQKKKSAKKSSNTTKKK